LDIKNIFFLIAKYIIIYLKLNLKFLTNEPYLFYSMTRGNQREKAREKNYKKKNVEKNLMSNNDIEDKKTTSQTIKYIDNRGWLVTKDNGYEVPIEDKKATGQTIENIDNCDCLVTKDNGHEVPIEQLKIVEKYNRLQYINFQLLYFIRKYNGNLKLCEKIKIIKQMMKLIKEREEFYRKDESNLQAIQIDYYWTDKKGCFFCNFLTGNVCVCKEEFMIEHSSIRFFTKDFIFFRQNDEKEEKKYMLIENIIKNRD